MIMPEVSAVSPAARSGLPPSFETAQDAGFVAACREAAGNNLLLEQQDYGIYLGERRMKWHGDSSLTVQNWCQFGKAFSGATVYALAPELPLARAG